MYWMNDLHVFTTQSAKKIFQHIGISGHDYCLSSHWQHFYETDPAAGLPAISREEVAQPYSHDAFEGLARRFAQHVSAMPTNDVDFFYCSFTAKIAHLFRHCGKPIHCQLSFRFEDNHLIPPAEIERLRGLLVSMVESGQLHVSANNRYDELYFHHFTGITPTYVPATGTYMTETYAPQSDKILIGPSRHYPVGTSIMRQIAGYLQKSFGLPAQTISEAYPKGFSWKALSQHKAIVVIPYTVSSGAFFEYLAMGIPMLFPSARLLAEWHTKHFLFVERKYALERMAGSTVKPVMQCFPDPNNDLDFESVLFWMRLCDWYQWDGVTTFDSPEELGAILRDLDTPEKSKRLLAQSRRDLQNAIRSWTTLTRKGA